MDEDRIETLRESSPEATSADARPVLSQGVKAWGPFRNGKFYVNVGFAEYTPEQAIRLAIEITECAMVAAAAQAEQDHPVPVLPPQMTNEQLHTAQRAAADEAAGVAGTMWAAAADHSTGVWRGAEHLRDVPTGDHPEPSMAGRPPWFETDEDWARYQREHPTPPMAGPQPGSDYGE